MFIKDNKRFNIYAAVTIADTQYPAGYFLDPDARLEMGIEEIPDPIRESEETHFNQELDVAPYLVSTPKPKEMLDATKNSKVTSRIVEIESGQLRAIREAVLYGDKTRLQQIDDDIKTERSKLIKSE
jgi:hypothetical protein